MAADRSTLTADELLGPRKLIDVDVEEPRGRVFARSLPFAIADRILEEAGARVGKKGASVEDIEIDVPAFLEDFLIHGIVDENGSPIFREEHRARLRPDLPFTAAMDMAMAVTEASGFRAKDDEQEEGAEGNAPGGGDEA